MSSKGLASHTLAVFSNSAVDSAGSVSFTTGTKADLETGAAWDMAYFTDVMPLGAKLMHAIAEVENKIRKQPRTFRLTLVIKSF